MRSAKERYQDLYHDFYHEADLKIGKHERAVHILRLKTRILKDQLHVLALNEERSDLVYRLGRACDCDCKALQRELSEVLAAKKMRGTNARYLLLAYGFLRGKAYHQIEHCLPGNEPDLEKIWAYLPSKGFSGEISLKQQLEDWLPQAKDEQKEAA